MAPDPHRRDVVLGVAAASAAAACSTPSATWAPPAPHAFRVVEHEWLPMRDGVRLSARLWIPEGSPSPAVLESVPYRKRDLYRAADDAWGPQLAAAGIAFVRLDVRGSGDSEGVITDEYSEDEIADCIDAIAWIAQQGWCTGAVGMRGISWGGINTLAVAARRPPALKAIMPMGCCDRRYTDDAHYVGGLLARANFQWGVLFKTVMAGPPDPDIVGPAWRDMWMQRLEATPPILTTWTQHQREDAYWRRASLHVDYDAIKTPAYFVSGWSDTYAHPVLRLLEKLKAPAKALVGLWGHTYPYTTQPLGLDWAKEEVRWWRHWLSGEATGIMDEPPLRAFMPYQTAREAGASRIPGRWIAAQSWPPRRPPQRLFLNLATLADKPATGPAIRVRDRGVVGGAKPEWLDRLPIEQTPDDDLSTLFDTSPLTAPLEILGAPSLRLRVSADKPAAAVVARLCEVRPDASSWLVTWGALNLTHRDSHASPKALDPGKPYDVTLDLRAIAHRFAAGSRIRLSLSTGLWPMLWPSPEQVELAVTPGVSFVDLPVRPQESVAAPFPIPEVISAAEPPASYEPASPGGGGRIVLTNNQPRFAYPVAGPGTELSTEREEVCEIIAGDFSTSHWRQRVRSGWKRGDWVCEVEASYDLSTRDGAFLLNEKLGAFENGKQVFQRSSDTTIPRDLA